MQPDLNPLRIALTPMPAIWAACAHGMVPDSKALRRSINRRTYGGGSASTGGPASEARSTTRSELTGIRQAPPSIVAPASSSLAMRSRTAPSLMPRSSAACAVDTVSSPMHCVKAVPETERDITSCVALHGTNSASSRRGSETARTVITSRCTSQIGRWEGRPRAPTGLKTVQQGVRIPPVPPRRAIWVPPVRRQQCPTWGWDEEPWVPAGRNVHTGRGRETRRSRCADRNGGTSRRPGPRCW